MVSVARGRLSPAAIDRGYPHQVEIRMPGDGLGVAGTNAVAAWCRAHAPDHQKRWARQRCRSALRYCFRDAEAAAAFKTAFGGLAVSTAVDA